MQKHVLTPKEKAVEEDRRKAQQANDLAANAKRSLLAGKKSKSNSRSFTGSPRISQRYLLEVNSTSLLLLARSRMRLPR